MKDRLLDPILLKFSLGLLSFTFFLSLFAGIFSGASVTTILIRAVVSALLMGLMGASIYFILNALVPEIQELWQSLSKNSSQENDNFGDNQFDSHNNKAGKNAKDVDDDFSDVDKKTFYSEEPSEATIKHNKKNKAVADDEILVEGVAIKNDTGVMAQAVSQVLDQDNE